MVDPIDQNNSQRGLTRFDAAYHRWNLTHAGAVTVLVLALELLPAIVPILLALAIWVFLSMALLFFLGHGLHPDGSGPVVPNVLTGTRALAAVSLFALGAFAGAAGSLPTLVHGDLAWWITGALGLVTLTDFFDGRLARLLGSGRFGATWDMESDAAFVLALAVFLRVAYSVTILVLLIGLMRYLYVLLFRYDSDPAGVPRAYKQYAKTVTALIVIGLLVCIAPVMGAPLRDAVVVVLLILQLVSFAWDLILQRRARVRS